MKKFKIIFLSVIIPLVIGVIIVCKAQGLDLKKIKVGEKDFFVEIADTPGERSKGLSGRKNLKENSGMLFIFENIDYHPFWMKDMLVPIDFIWISEKKIVGITESVQPEKYQPPNILVPKNKVDMVLETAAGFTKKNNIKIGDGIIY